jgi:hypothetical protein
VAALKGLIFWLFSSLQKRCPFFENMASLAELVEPIDGTEYLDIDAMIRALDD